MKTWMVRVWFAARNEDFIDEMPTLEYIFETEEEALFQKSSMRSTEVMVAGNLTS